MSGFLKQILQKLGLSGDRPPFEGFYVYALLLLIGFFLADLAQLKVRGYLLPTLISRTQGYAPRQTLATKNPNYGEILRRNILNSDGKIPPAVSEVGGDKPVEDGPAVPSNLPLRLIGTIVHANPARSIATIELRNRNKSLAFSTDDEIEDVGAKITLIERLKVTFRNLQTHRLEYIEIKESFAVNFGAARAQPMGAAKLGSDEEIKQVADNKFTVSRSALQKHLNNLPDLLQQARAVPNIDPATGAVNGFRLLDIAPGSIFENLGVRRNDLIKSVNGTAVDSINKAMELVNTLRDADNINVTVERNGRDEDLGYSFSQ